MMFNCKGNYTTISKQWINSQMHCKYHSERHKEHLLRFFPSSKFPINTVYFTWKDKVFSVAYMFLFCFILKESNAKTFFSNSAAQIQQIRPCNILFGNLQYRKTYRTIFIISLSTRFTTAFTYITCLISAEH